MKACPGLVQAFGFQIADRTRSEEERPGKNQEGAAEGLPGTAGTAGRALRPRGERIGKGRTVLHGGAGFRVAALTAS